MERITSQTDIARALDALVEADPRLATVRDRAGAVDLRLSEPCFATLASIVIAQQVSRASARAMLDRLHARVEPLTAARLLAAGQSVLVEAGISRVRQRALLGLAHAILAERLDLQAVARLPTGEAIGVLVDLPGIGPWTAEVFLLTAGHPDVFPSRDLALQAAVDALQLSARPDAASLAAIAESWRPFRSVAARFFWAWYREMKGREVLPLSTSE